MIQELFCEDRNIKNRSLLCICFFLQNKEQYVAKYCSFSRIHEIILIKKTEDEGRSETEADKELAGWKTLPRKAKG